MEVIDEANRNRISVICRLLYNSYNIPIVCFDKNLETICYNCLATGFDSFFLKIGMKAKVGETSFVNTDVGPFGVLSENEFVLVMGPFSHHIIDETSLDGLVSEYGIKNEDRSVFKNMLETIPSISLSSFTNCLSLITYLFTEKEITLIDLLKESEKGSAVGEKQVKEIWKERGVSHGTYYLEKRILSYVREGDVDGLTSFFDQMSKSVPPVEGKLADDALRQAKNLFIGFIALVGKDGAIKGNLDIEQTYQLIDLYTQECEKCSMVEEVNKLRFNAIMDFTRRVAELRHPEAYSEEVYSALQFLKSHTNQPIGVMDVVEHIGKSRSYFLARFKKETGDTVAHFILKAKLQESKLLLRYSDRSLAEISEFLYFSSQSHFQNLFKKEYGITPLTYRREKQR